MSLRVYCPDCGAPRTAPEVGARVTCRVCDRVFRAGTRAVRRPRRDDSPDRERLDNTQKATYILGGVALLLVVLTFGGGLLGWYLLNREAARQQAEDERLELEENDGPPMVEPEPIGPEPIDPE